MQQNSGILTHMLVDGKLLAKRLLQELQNELSHTKGQPHLTVFTCAPNFATKKYLNLKTKRAKWVGLGISVIELPADCSTQDAIQSVAHAAMQTDGIIVQLPLPAHLDTDAILATVPPSMDVDGIHYDGSGASPLHPVAGAIAHVVHEYDVLLAGRSVVVVGDGRLVGTPAAAWAKSQGANVTVLTKDTEDNALAIAAADILILGTGQPGLITPEMVKEGVVIIDAGTSESGGQLVGDADPACAAKAALFTPVPGGVGPLTVAVLLRNVLSLTQDGQG